MDLATKITKLLGTRPLTDLADAVGASRGSFNNYVNRGSMPRADVALRISRELDVPFDWLVDDEQNWPPSPAGGRAITEYPLDELLDELVRRYILDHGRLLREIETLSRVPWAVITRAAYEAVKAGEDLPAEYRSLIDRAVRLQDEVGGLRGKYDVVFHARLYDIVVEGKAPSETDAVYDPDEVDVAFRSFCGENLAFEWALDVPRMRHALERDRDHDDPDTPPSIEHEQVEDRIRDLSAEAHALPAAANPKPQPFPARPKRRNA
ncbi:MAG: helix-turn-helix transcriptional regulator [Planctomycetota bacterium]